MQANNTDGAAYFHLKKHFALPHKRRAFSFVNRVFIFIGIPAPPNEKSSRSRRFSAGSPPCRSRLNDVLYNIARIWAIVNKRV